MKLWLLRKLTGLFGVPITAALSGLAGTLVAKLYALLGGIPLIADLAREILGQMPPEHAAAFSPAVIGAATGAGVFALIQQRLNTTLRDENKAVQRVLNDALPTSEQLEVDGLPLAKTLNAARTVAARAASARGHSTQR